MKLIYKFRKSLFVAGLMVSMFALNVVSAFAQAEPEPIEWIDLDQILANAQPVANTFGLTQALAAIAVIGISMWVFARLVRVVTRRRS